MYKSNFVKRSLSKRTLYVCHVGLMKTKLLLPLIQSNKIKSGTKAFTKPEERQIKLTLQSQ